MKLFKNRIKYIGALLLAVIFTAGLFFCATGCDDNYITITVWTYYNGDQQTSFNKLIDEFNKKVGDEKGITVEQKSQGDINVLAEQLLDSVQHKSGASAIPDLAAVYSESAFILDKHDALVDMDEYFTKNELAEYVPSYIEEGRLVQNGPLYLLPVSKSTEVVAYNATDWAPFEKATKISIDSIKTIEDMVSAAEAYYEWSGGKALYGRDSLENYVYIGTTQLGHEMFKVDADGTLSLDLDRETFRSLWNNYYAPMVNGYFYGEKKDGKSKFASDLAKFGNILALTCSTSAITYFPTELVEEGDNKHPVEAVIRKPLLFENRNRDAYVQQGAAYCMLKTSEEKQSASAVFLKWLTEKENNIEFSLQSSYCPAKTDANDLSEIKKAFGTASTAKSKNILQSLTVSAELLVSGDTYACKPFEGAKEVRAYLGEKLEDVTIADCRKIEAAMKTGKTRAEALSDAENVHDFDAWFDELEAHIKTLLAK